MEDDKIKGLFDDFQPELSSSAQFMSKLQKNMEAVEIVRKYNTSLQRRNKLAVAIAAASGFVMGIILTLIFPMVRDWLTIYSLSVPQLNVDAVPIDYSMVTWIIMAGVSVVTALSAYEIAMARLRQ